MVAAILFMTFFGFNDEGSHSVLVFVSVCGGGSHSAPDLVQNGYPLPPTLISRGIMYVYIYIYIYGGTIMNRFCIVKSSFTCFCWWFPEML